MNEFKLVTHSNTLVAHSNHVSALGINGSLSTMPQRTTRLAALRFISVGMIESCVS